MCGCCGGSASAADYEGEAGIVPLSACSCLCSSVSLDLEGVLDLPGIEIPYWLSRPLAFLQVLLKWFAYAAIDRIKHGKREFGPEEIRK